MNVTMIEDIPDINELEKDGERYIPEVDKFIRNGHSPPPESGMKNNFEYKQMGNKYYGSQYENFMRNSPQENFMRNSQANYLIPQQENFMRNSPQQNFMRENYMYPSQNSSYPYNAEQIDVPKDNLNCPDVYAHVKNCPMCSNYFKKTDNVIYIIIIVVLAIICLLLFKKVLDL